MNKTQRTIATVLLIGVIAFSSVLILNKLLGRTRLDLTQHGIYTLSQGTNNIVSQLNQDLKMKLFYSRVAAIKGPEQIRFYNNYYFYVRELLQEYVNISGGKLELDVLDPRPFSDEEEEALSYGIQKFPISDSENFFFGLAVTSELGKDAVIDFFEPDRQEFVEYDISRLLVQITQRDKKKIGVLSSLSVLGSDMSPYMMQMMQMQGRQPEQPWNIVTHLREEYEIEPIESDADRIPADIDFLMLVHPKNLSRQILYAVDQYVMRGGKLLVFVDPFSINDQPPQNPQNPMAGMNYDSSSNINQLLEKWGVKMEPSAIAADPEMALTAQISRNTPAAPIVTFLQLNEENVNTEEVITGKLHDMRMLFSGSFEIENMEGVEIVPLLESTDAGGTWTPQNAFELRMPNPETMARGIAPRDDKVILACRITGKLSTNFPDGPPPSAQSEDGEEEEAAEESEDLPEHLTESSAEAAVIAVADVDMISNTLAYQNAFFGVQQVGDNASFVLNAIEFLSGTGDLIDIRSRGKFRRPFEVVDKIEAEAEERTADRVNEINGRIQDYQARLEELGASANDENVKLLQNEAMAERTRIQNEIRKAQRELRELNAGKRESIEQLGLILQTVNMVLAPAAVLIIAIVLGGRRYAKAKKYAARRTQE